MDGRTLAGTAVGALVLAGMARHGSRATVRALAQRVNTMTGGGGVLLSHVPAWPAVKAKLLQDGFTADSDLGTTFADIVVEAMGTLKRKEPDAKGRAATRKNAEALAWEWVHGRYTDFVNNVENFTDPLVLFREITAKDEGAINLDELGTYWSWDPLAAEAHWARGGSHWLISCMVPARHVDWMESAVQNVRMPYEREITLYAGSPVRILAIRNDEGVVLDDEMGTA